MLKSFARAAGFLAYLFITLEMLFMVTPFAPGFHDQLPAAIETSSHTLPMYRHLYAFTIPICTTLAKPRG